MKKIALYSICFLWFTLGWTQGEKGASGSVESNDGTEPNNYWALIVGISEYERIKPLEYADKDAMFFLEYLKSTLGEKLPDDHIQLLLNEKATGPAFETSLRWLAKNAEEGDAVFIYFSGHGGTENYTISKRGYLLGYDSRQDSYSDGNLTLLRLEDYLNTYASKDIMSYVILDACHSGKAQTEYMGDLNTELSRDGSFSDNIVKILSASGEELSYENKKWGGGHGVFTYYLVRGLSGEADNSPTDSLVTVKELRRFLEDYVPAETDDRQNPRIVFDELKHPLGVSNNLFLATIEDVGVEFDYTYGLLASRDPGALFSDEDLRLIDEIQEKLDRYEFYNYEGTGAVIMIQDIFNTSDNEALKSRLKDELYISSMEFSHGFINVFMDDSHLRDTTNYDEEVGFRLMKDIDEYYTDSFEVAQIESKKLFYKAVKYHWDYHDGELTVNDILNVADELDEAIKYVTEASYLYYLKAVLYYHGEEYDKAIRFSKKSIQYAPNWPNPVINMGNIYSEMGDDYFQNAVNAYLKAASLSKKDVTALRNLGTLYLTRYDESYEDNDYYLGMEYLLKAIAKDPSSYDAWNYLTMYEYDEMDTLLDFGENKIVEYVNEERYSEAADICEILADYYVNEGKEARGISYYEKAIEIEKDNDNKAYFRGELATIYQDKVRLNDGLSAKENEYIQKASDLYQISYNQTKNQSYLGDKGSVLDLYLLDYNYHTHWSIIKFYTDTYSYDWVPAINTYNEILSDVDDEDLAFNALLSLGSIYKYGNVGSTDEYLEVIEKFEGLFDMKLIQEDLSEGERAIWLLQKGLAEMRVGSDIKKALEIIKKAYEMDPEMAVFYYLEALILAEELEKAEEINEYFAYELFYQLFEEGSNPVAQYYSLFSAMIYKDDPELVENYLTGAIWEGFSDIPYLKYHPAFTDYQDIIDEVINKNKKYLKY